MSYDIEDVENVVREEMEGPDQLWKIYLVGNAPIDVKPQRGGRA